jgi:secreted trypsin-like serine protease
MYSILFHSSLLIEVVIGRDTNTSKTSPLFQTDSNNKQEFDWGYQRIKIKQEIKHPFYDATTLSYDIMLLQLEHPPVFDMNDTTTFPYMRLDSSDVLDSIEESNETATLPQSRLQTMLENNNESKGHFIDNQDTLMALGWGYTQSSRVGIGNPSENLQQAMLGYVPNDECKLAHEQFLTYEGRIFDDMMCTYASQRDACYGDSGGPIILPGEDPRQHIQVGIISWYVTCVYCKMSFVSSRCDDSFRSLNLTCH